MTLKIRRFYGFTYVRSRSPFRRIIKVTTPEGEVIENPLRVSFSKLYLPKYSTLIFLILGLTFFGGAYYYLDRHHQIEHSWKSAQAKVIANEPVTTKSKGNKPSQTKYRPILEFIGENGAPQTFRGNLSTEPKPLGEAELVKYNPVNRSEFVRERDLSLEVVGWILGGFGVASILTALVVFMFGPFDKITVRVDHREWVFKRGQYNNRIEPR